MGRDLAAEFVVARRTFEEADDRLGVALSRLCFEGPEETLRLTANAQPAILTASVAAYRALEEVTGLEPAAVAGHSLGEWSALVAAGALGLGDAVVGVRERGRLIQEAVPPGEGAMAAILGLDADAVAALCAEAAEADVLVPANLNGGGQVVVAGHARAVDRLLPLAAARGARAQLLAVSAPFHCPLMEPAAAGLARHLAGVTFHAPRLPVVSSVEARPVRSAAELPGLLVKQVTAPVRWEETVRALAALGATLALETGPGRVLSGLSRRIAPALVTGGSRGIGRAVALRLAAGGATVVVNYRDNAPAAEETVRLIAAAGGRACAARFDVGDAEAVRVGVQNIVDEHGRLDLLVNNAGLAVDALLLRLKEEDWERVLRTNLTGVFHCTKAAVRAMVRARYGRIVNLTSVVAEMGNAGQGAYAAAKAGVIGFTKSLAREVAARGVTVNAVAPGLVETDMTAGLDDQQRAFYTNVIPAGRIATPEEVAAAVAFLVSPEAGYITGQVLHVNGGLYM